jgi:hypothetical protein
MRLKNLIIRYKDLRMRVRGFLIKLINTNKKLNLPRMSLQMHRYSSMMPTAKFSNTKTSSHVKRKILQISYNNFLLLKIKKKTAPPKSKNTKEPTKSLWMTLKKPKETTKK